MLSTVEDKEGKMYVLLTHDEMTETSLLGKPIGQQTRWTMDDGRIVKMLLKHKIKRSMTCV